MTWQWLSCGKVTDIGVVIMWESDCDMGVVIMWESDYDIGVVIMWERVTVTWEWLSRGRE